MPTPRRSYTSGFKEANKVLQELGPAVQKKVLRGAVREGGQVWLKAVKAAAPRSAPGERSEASKQYGRLQTNLRLQFLRKVPKTAVGIRVWTRDAFWGFFLEFGTAFISARPWFRPAIDRTGDKALQVMGEAIGRGIEQTANWLRRKYPVKKK